MTKKRDLNEECSYWKSGHKFNYYDALCMCGAWAGNFADPDRKYQDDEKPEK